MSGPLLPLTGSPGDLRPCQCAAKLCQGMTLSLRPAWTLREGARGRGDSAGLAAGWRHGQGCSPRLQGAHKPGCSLGLLAWCRAPPPPRPSWGSGYMHRPPRPGPSPWAVPPSPEWTPSPASLIRTLRPRDSPHVADQPARGSRGPDPTGCAIRVQSEANGRHLGSARVSSSGRWSAEARWEGASSRPLRPTRAGYSSSPQAPPAQHLAPAPRAQSPRRVGGGAPRAAARGGGSESRVPARPVLRAGWRSGPGNAGRPPQAGTCLRWSAGTRHTLGVGIPGTEAGAPLPGNCVTLLQAGPGWQEAWLWRR